jgi:hypothetical protein
MSIHYNPTIPIEGMICYLDAANPKSYPGSGTTWFDLTGNRNNFTINNTAFNSTYKYMDFNGAYGCAKKIDSDMIVNPFGDVTVLTWTRVKNSTAEWRTLLRGLSSGGDHQVIIENGGWALGMYDNINGTAFNNTGFSQQSLPGYGTTQWVLMSWRWSNSSPYYVFTYNDSPEIVRGSLTSINARFKCGVCSIGAYNNAVQSNPSTASQYWGDISNIVFYNRYLSNEEIKSYFNASRGRYGI